MFVHVERQRESRDRSWDENSSDNFFWRVFLVEYLRDRLPIGRQGYYFITNIWIITGSLVSCIKDTCQLLFALSVINMACWAEYGNSDLNQTTNRQNNQRNSNILFQGRTGYLEDRKGIPLQETFQTLFSKFLRILVTKASTKRILKKHVHSCCRFVFQTSERH